MVERRGYRGHSYGGYIACIDGSDGSGKSTQIRRLEADLKDEGFQVVVARDPGGTRIGEQIREVLLNRENAEMGVSTEYLLFNASRAQMIDEVVRDPLAAGKVVILDRFDYSTWAYQFFAGGLQDTLDWNTFSFVQNAVTRGLRPDTTQLLLATHETMKKRMGLADDRALAKFADRLECKGAAFHARVREGYMDVAQKSPDNVRVIDTDDMTPDHVYAILKTNIRGDMEALGLWNSLRSSRA